MLWEAVQGLCNKLTIKADWAVSLPTEMEAQGTDSVTSAAHAAVEGLNGITDSTADQASTFAAPASEEDEEFEDELDSLLNY